MSDESLHWSRFSPHKLTTLPALSIVSAMVYMLDTSHIVGSEVTRDEDQLAATPGGLGQEVAALSK